LIEFRCRHCGALLYKLYVVYTASKSKGKYTIREQLWVDDEFVDRECHYPFGADEVAQYYDYKCPVCGARLNPRPDRSSISIGRAGPPPSTPRCAGA
jgi:phage FluMu protein Com